MQLNNQVRKMTRSEAGKRGAFKLNSDTEKKHASVMKGVQTNLKKNPNYYKELAKRKAKKDTYPFKP